MADIEVKCGKCGKAVTVSEFADVAALVCHSCGSKMQKSGALPEQDVKKPKSTIKVLAVRDTETAEATTQPGAPAAEWRFHKNTAKKDEGRPIIENKHVWASWIITIVLGGLMGVLRYTSILGDQPAELLTQYGPYAAIAIHVFIILSAFKHSVFQGILCLLIPPYPYYYLLVVSDEFYKRAFVVAIMVGIGEDSFLYFAEVAKRVVDSVTAWISSGG